MEEILQRLQRTLNQQGIRHKVLDGRTIDRLTEYFKQEVQQAKLRYMRAPTPTAKANAYEKLNNLTSLMESIL